MKKIFTAFLALTSFWLSAQVTMPVTGNKYVTQCYGVITDDNLGGNGYYSNNANGVLVVNPGMTGSVALTFTAFNCPGDYLYVYSGDYSQGNATLLGSYSYSVLPNSGNTINVSGTMSLRFVSNGYTNGTGFQATFFTNLTGTLAANFTGPSAANYNSSVPFVNSSTGALTYLWDFGDGTTSTEKNPTHEFTQSGTRTVRLIASNCSTSDTITKTINIGNAPNASLPNDTLKLTANCGYSASTSWTVTNGSGAGGLNYGLVFDDSSLVYQYTFENGSIGDFTIPTNVYNSTLATTTASKNSGSRSLELSGYNYNYDAELDLNGLKPNYIKYATRSNSYTYDAGLIDFKDALGRNLFAGTRWRYGDLYITYRGANNIYYYNYYGTFNQGDWVEIEFKNIDWTNKTFDFYIEGVLVQGNAMFEDANFATTTPVLNAMHWVNTSTSATANLDDVIITDDGLESIVSINPASVNVFGGSSSTMIVTANATDLNAGVYYLSAKISSNDTSYDGTTLPVELTVNGSSDFTANSQCIYFNQVPVNIGGTDTLEISNTGCADLTFDSVTTHSAVFTAAFAKSLLAPDSAENLVVTCNASASGTYLDTVYFYEGSTVHKVCLFASFINTAIASVPDTLDYTLEGCPGAFSVPFTLANTGLANLNWLEGYSAYFLYDKFNSTTAPDWYTVPGSRSNGCGQIEGSSSLTLTGYNGMVYLTPLDFSKGGKISFTAGPSINCYTPSNYTAYYISVQYRTSPTAAWTTIQAFYPSTGTQNFSVNLPSAAWSTTTEIRIGATNSYLYGTWLLDNLVVEHRTATDLTPNSGSLTPGSSTTVNANLDLTGYPAGTYYRQVGVASNDATFPNKTFWVKILVEGEAELNIAPKLCFELDTTFMGATSEFDVEMINVGCRAMGIDSVISTSTSLTYGVDTMGAQIGDTATLTMTFIPGSTGAFNDSLHVYTTDSAFSLCVSGYVSMPPVIEMDTTLVAATAVNCGDSVTITLPIYNSGSSTLTWNVEQGRPLEVLIIDEYFYPAHLPKLLDLLNNIPQVHVVRENTLSAITARLPKTDLVIFPPITANGQQTYFNSLYSTLTNWMTNDGGKVVLMASSFFNINMSYFSASSTVYTNSNLTQYVTSTFANHPYLANVPSSFTSPAGTYGAYLYNGNTMLSNTYYRESLVTNTFGAGEVIFYGWSFTSTDNNPFRTIMRNIVESTRDSLEQADWISIAPKNGSTAAGDTGYVSLTFSSEGLTSGTYNKKLSTVVGALVLSSSTTISPKLVSIFTRGNRLSG